MDPDLTRAEFMQEDGGGPEWCESEYQFFLGWQEAANALIAIWPAAGRSEVLTLQRIINADVADARSRNGTFMLDLWAEDIAYDIQWDAVHMVDTFKHGDRAFTLELVKSIRQSATLGMERAQEG